MVDKRYIVEDPEIGDIIADSDGVVCLIVERRTREQDFFRYVIVCGHADIYREIYKGTWFHEGKILASKRKT